MEGDGQGVMLRYCALAWMDRKSTISLMIDILWAMCSGQHNISLLQFLMHDLFHSLSTYFLAARHFAVVKNAWLSIKELFISLHLPYM
jgi:hypothetical protein